MPRDVRKRKDDLPIPQRDELRRSAVALIHELSEPLTAIQNYLEAASCLHQADTEAAAEKLDDVFDKSRGVLVRANGIVAELRSLLRDERATTDA